MRQQSLFPGLASPHRPGPSSIMAGLNSYQLEAVTTTQGSVLVIAGAGSGKTRTLVHRMAYLVEQGVAPDSILLLTFTRKAAQEMLSRAALLMDGSCGGVMGGTFHGMANLLLRRFGRYTGYPTNFTILDRSDSEGIINLLKSSLGLSGGGRRFPSKRVIINMISGAVNKNIDFSDYLEERYFHLVEFSADINSIREHYANFKRDHALMDYDDLLVNFRDLLRDHPEARTEISDRFHYVMVDEYQDTNRIQAEIVALISSSHKNVMVVGDDAQSIYSFRGADFKNIMDFPDLFSGTRVVRLEENYRSAQPILEATNAIISQAAEKYAKTLFSNIPGADKPSLFRARDEQEQARYVVDKIETFQREGVPLAEMAVLFRSGFHSYKLELELANHQIPFETRGGMKLTESAHVKDVICYLRIISNPADHLSWNRILLQIDKVGPKTAEKMLAAIRGAETPLQALDGYKGGKVWQPGLDRLVKALHGLARLERPGAQLEQVLDYYRPIFERIYQDDYPSRSRDLDQLGELLASYDNLQDFIDDTALDPPQEAALQNPDADRLILSTVHSAKGLEWNKVFVLNLVEGKFPSGQAQLPEEREEERRLLYVAATRAREHLFFIAPRLTAGPDRMPQTAMVSEFISALAPELLAGPARRQPLPPWPETPAFTASTAGKPSSASTDIAECTTGRPVRHSFFGEGKVIKVTLPKTVEVFFPRHGLKKLHLDYAKLEVL
ncbi:MAG: ATP-dependent helicase [Deltaproteobacteria bacterium]|jgi:DNA helicase-2/ATP-dependent DNA helicase PcrA|nr:ATP-dependent helicase [Deltaproteobacteria bacterium]